MTLDVVCEEDSIMLARLSTTGGSVVVSSSVTIQEGFTWFVHMQGRTLHNLQDSIDLNVTSASDVKRLIHYVDNSGICCGNSDEKFIKLIATRKGKFMDSSGMSLV